MQGYEFCACGTGMTDVSLPIFQVAVQKRRIQDDRRQGSFQLMAAAICFQLRAQKLGPIYFVGTILGPKTPV
jgi:hypothetical protein